MVRHSFTYPLGHILTAAYWQQVQDGGLHFTVSDTGWAKSAWGKLYGQWLAGAAVFVYDYDKFVPKDLLRVVSEYGVTSFCAPPTIYRYLIKEDLHVRPVPPGSGPPPPGSPSTRRSTTSSCASPGCASGKATARPR